MQGAGVIPYRAYEVKRAVEWVEPRKKIGYDRVPGYGNKN